MVEFSCYLTVAVFPLLLPPHTKLFKLICGKSYFIKWLFIGCVLVCAHIHTHAKLQSKCISTKCVPSCLKHIYQATKQFDLILNEMLCTFDACSMFMHGFCLFVFHFNIIIVWLVSSNLIYIIIIIVLLLLLLSTSLLKLAWNATI